MTIAYADPVDGRDNGEFICWAISLLLVLVFHFVAALWLLSREAPVEPNKPPPPAALLDLAPLPLPGAGGAPGAPAPTKPAPTQPMPPKPVKPPVQQIKPVVPPLPAPAPKMAVPLPAPPKPKPPAPKPQAPQAAPEPPRTSGSAAPVLLDPVRVWQFGVMQQLEKFKKQSVSASYRGEQGVVGLRITIDRLGNILSASIANSSGYNSLDNQALSMARLARRLPPLPPEIKGDRYWFVVTIEFTVY